MAHAVIQFSGPISAETRATLSSSGITLLKSLGHHSFFAALPSTPTALGTLTSADPVVSVTKVKSRWKLHPELASTYGSKRPSVGVSPTGEPILAAYVLFHADVPLAGLAVNVAARHGGVVRTELRSVNGLVIELPLSRVNDLADEDSVQYIEPALPPFAAANDGNRALVGADIVQTAPYNLDGAGVTAMVYDTGQALSTHLDFGGRLTAGDSSFLSDHSTHVACTLGGSGAASSGTWRGMAPGVSLLSYGFQSDNTAIPLYTNPGDIEADYTNAIITLGADIANNSLATNVCLIGWPCTITGDYGVTSALLDAIVGGSLGAPARIIWANGNERSCTRCQTEGVTTAGGYHSTAPPACSKNPIAVGAVNADNDSIASFSSFGPCDDGRLKPDISAPGAQVGGDLGVTSCSLTGINQYSVKIGTSMAAPTVTGLAALLLEDFRIQFPASPDFLNSTLKILLAHNAVDIGNTGPDYQSGYGSVRIQPTIDFMRTGSFTEDQVAGGGLFSTTVVVDPTDTELRVTLAWDDVPGTPNVSPALVNDLDLRVFSPSAVRHFPWTLDPANPALPATQTTEDHINNIEQVVVNAPEAGVWVIEVAGTTVPVGTQTFSLAVTPSLAGPAAGTLNVTVDLEGVNTAVVRNVAFVITDCALAPIQTTVVSMSFDATGTGSTSIPINNANAQWISANEGHSLGRLLPLGPPLPIGVAFTSANRLQAGDLTGDNLVDVEDLSLLASNWNTAGSVADINGDGLQNDTDLSLIIGNLLFLGGPSDGCP